MKPSTAEHQAVASALNDGRPSTAQEVWETAKRECPTISLRTVRHRLQVMAADGKVLRMELPEQELRYKLNDPETILTLSWFCCSVCGVMRREFILVAEVIEGFKRAAVVAMGTCQRCSGDQAEARERITEARRRSTAEQGAVWDVLNDGRAMTAQKVWEAAKRECPTISLRTVHHRLRAMVADGSIRRVVVPASKFRYRYGHLGIGLNAWTRCALCGRLAQMMVATLEYNSLPFSISDLLLWGACRECRGGESEWDANVRELLDEASAGGVESEPPTTFQDRIRRAERIGILTDPLAGHRRWTLAKAWRAVVDPSCDEATAKKRAHNEKTWYRRHFGNTGALTMSLLVKGVRTLCGDVRHPSAAAAARAGARTGG